MCEAIKNVFGIWCKYNITLGFKKTETEYTVMVKPPLPEETPLIVIT